MSVQSSFSVSKSAGKKVSVLAKGRGKSCRPKPAVHENVRLSNSPSLGPFSVRTHRVAYSEPFLHSRMDMRPLLGTI